MGDSSHKKSFEKNLEELEGILNDLESSKLPLGELVEKYERAKVLLKECRAKLDDAELSIKKLNPDGSEEPLAPASSNK